ncbi:hypothetical protein PCE1_000688 [Barthelona sp. PCE]
MKVVTIGVPSGKRNKVKTHRYSWASFVFVNIYDQFVANPLFFFFLAVVIITFFAQPISPFLAVIPIVVLIIIGMIKAGMDDYRLHNNDRIFNEMQYTLVPERVTVQSKTLRSGDIIQLISGDVVPCDCVLLHNSSPVFVNESAITGESLLKRPSPIMQQTTGYAAGTVGRIDIDDDTTTPGFTAVYKRDQVTVQIGVSSLLLQNATIEMGACECVVIYTGHEASSYRFIGKSKVKVFQFERFFQKILFTLLIFYLVLIFLIPAFYAIYQSQIGGKSWYLRWYLPPTYDFGTYWSVVGNYVVIYSLIIPISFLISIELFRITHAFFVEVDKDMCVEGPSSIQDTYLPPSVINTSTDTTGPIDTLAPNENYATAGPGQYCFPIIPPGYTTEFSQSTVQSSRVLDSVPWTSTVFFDKTGTLTENSLSLQNAFVVGTGRLSKQSLREAMAVCPLSRAPNTPTDALLLGMLLSNDVSIGYRDPDQPPIVTSCSVDECALLALFSDDYDIVLESNTMIITHRSTSVSSRVIILHTVPYSSENAFSASLVEFESGERTIFLKGSDQSISCFISSEDANICDVQSSALAYDGHRVLAHCWGPVNSNNIRSSSELIVYIRSTRNLSLSGVSGVMDRVCDGTEFMLTNMRNSQRLIWIISGDRAENVKNLLRSCKTLLPSDSFFHLECYDNIDLKLVGEQLKNLLTEVIPFTEIVSQQISEEVDGSRAEDQLAMHSRFKAMTPFILNIPGSLLHRLFEDPDIEMMSIDSDSDASLVSNGGGMERVRSSEIAPLSDEETVVKTEVCFLLFLLTGFCGIVTCTRCRPHVKARVLDEYHKFFAKRRKLFKQNRGLVFDFYAATERINAEDTAMLTQKACSLVAAQEPATTFTITEKQPHRKRYTLIRKKLKIKKGLLRLRRPYERDPPTNPTLMYVGDSANDLPALTHKHVIGIGIRSREGMQTSRSADISLPHIGFLVPLVNWHGRNSHIRLGWIAFFSIYKNLLLLPPQIFFDSLSGWSGTLLYPEFATVMYNLLFTVFPVVVWGVLEQDVQKSQVMTEPSATWLATEVNQRHLYNWKIFAQFSLLAILEGILIWIAARYSFDKGIIQISGLNTGKYTLGQLVFSMVVFQVIAKAGFDYLHWTNMHHASIYGSVAIFFTTMAIISSWYWLDPDEYQVFFALLGSPIFYFLILLPPVFSLIEYSIRTRYRQGRPFRWQMMRRDGLLKYRNEDVSIQISP